jgi:hypothetical protein
MALDIAQLQRLRTDQRLRVVKTIGAQQYLTLDDDPDALVRELCRLAAIGQGVEIAALSSPDMPIGKLLAMAGVNRSGGGPTRLVQFLYAIMTQAPGLTVEELRDLVERTDWTPGFFASAQTEANARALAGQLYGRLS